MLAETSKYIAGTEKRYSVTDCGRVYMHSYTDTIGRLLKGRWIKPTYSSQGYVRCSIFGKFAFLHRLVAKEFVDNPDSKPHVNHKDCDKHNNNASNLEWVTRSENTIHAYDNNRMPHGENHAKTSLTKENVKEIRRLLELKIHKMSEIGVMFNVSRKVIFDIHHKKSWNRM